MPNSFIPTIETLSPAALTVRAQAISPNDNGQLKWDVFFPRQDVPSVELNDVMTLNYRPTADRREWNAKGRNVPLKQPELRRVSIVPIEANHKIEEYEMQRLNEQALGNSAIIEQVMEARIPGRVDVLTRSVYRRLEVDAFTAWTQGTVTQRNPQNATETYTASFGFSSSRLQVAATAWNSTSLNAYDEFLAWMRSAIDAVGGIEGVLMRIPTRNEIVKDAPTLAGGARMTLSQLDTRIQDDLGSAFNLLTFEETVDVFDDGGTATTRTKVFPQGKIAAIPSGGVVGYSAFAPVVRAMEMVRSIGEAGIDSNGITIFYDEANGGRELSIEAQANAMPVPNEQRVYILDVGV